MIEKGKLGLNLHYLIEKKKLDSQNKILLDQFTLGKQVDSPDATKLPVRLAIALLKNRRGEIDLDIPVSGQIDDPKFSIGRIIIKILLNLLVKAATSPFALLGSLFGGGEELSYVEFDHGLSNLNEAGVKKIDTLIKALHDRPSLKISFIGSTPQHNTPSRSWLEFYRDRRLGVAQHNGRLTPDRARRLERVMDRLEHWIDDAKVVPSLLHGDLWGGNYLVDRQGNPVLIDPAVYFGDREAEIAFTELFGGFGTRFHAAYNEAWPLDRGYADRRDLYNLYHLLNHLNLFGEGYGASVDAILRHYTG